MSLKNLEMLKISIKARVEDFDNFFKKHFTDDRIPFFEKQKFRLRKLLHEAEEGTRIPRELNIRFSVDDETNAAKQNALKAERPKTPTKMKSIKSTQKMASPKPDKPTFVDRSKSPLKAQNTLVKIKMTKEEYEEYMRVAAEKQKLAQAQQKQMESKNQQVKVAQKAPAPQPGSSKPKPPSSTNFKSPIRIKRV